MLRFKKATRNNGVDGHFEESDPRVTVEPNEFPAPIYPEDEGFWDQFTQTIHAASMAQDKAAYRRGVSPALEASNVNRADLAAEAVHRDWPTEILTIGARYATSGFRTIEPLEGVFTDKVVLLNYLMSWAAWAVSANSFCAKWHFMMPRPEEVAGAIVRNEIDAPEHVKLQLFDMVSRQSLLADQRKFTTYPEGSPNHPSYNAMHSAAAGAAATVVKVVMELSKQDTDMINLTARNMAYFRTTAGVHYPQDNKTGLWLGQETVKRLLPTKLAELGVDAALTENLLADAYIEW